MLAYPPETAFCSPRFLHHRSGIHIGTRPGPGQQPCDESLQFAEPLLKHAMVILACCVAADPCGGCVCLGSRSGVISGSERNDGSDVRKNQIRIFALGRLACHVAHFAVHPFPQPAVEPLATGKRPGTRNAHPEEAQPGSLLPDGSGQRRSIHEILTFYLPSAVHCNSRGWRLLYSAWTSPTLQP